MAIPDISEFDLPDSDVPDISAFDDPLTSDINAPGFVSTLKSTAGGQAASWSRALQDLPALRENAVLKSVNEWGKDVQRRNPMFVTDLETAVTHPGQVLKEGSANALAQTPAMIGGGLLGGALGYRLGGSGGSEAGRRIGAMIGAAVPTFGQEYGGIREEQDAKGIDDKQQALMAAAPATAIEFGMGPQRLVAGMIGKGFTGSAKELAAKLARETAGMSQAEASKYVLKHYGKQALRMGAEEGAEEFPQNMLEAWGAHEDPVSRETLNKAATGSLLGFAGGLALGAPVSGVQHMQANRMLNDMPAEPAPQPQTQPASPVGPLTQAADVAVSTGLAQPRAGVFDQPMLFPFTDTGAASRADILNRQGQPSRVIPHPERPGRFAVVPDEYGLAGDDLGRMTALERELELYDALTPKTAEGVNAGVVQRINEINAEIGKLRETEQKRLEAEAKRASTGASVTEVTPFSERDGARQIETQPPERGRAALLPNQEEDNASLQPAIGHAAGTSIGPEKEGHQLPRSRAMALALPDAAASEIDGNSGIAASGDQSDVAVPAGWKEALTGQPANRRLGSKTESSAHEAATSPQNDTPQPSPAMIEAGNYRKGHLNLGGLDISIENPQGSTRSGTDKGGKPWSVTMQAHYGYIKGTVGRDKDHVDVYVKPGTVKLEDSDSAYVVNQIDPETGRFDEHKIILGAKNALEANAIYDAHFNDKSGPKRRKTVARYSMMQLRDWLKSGDTTKPALQIGGKDAGKWQGVDLKNIEVNVKAQIAESGESVTITENAQAAIADVDKRLDFAKRLLECLAS